jgi:hypothetical protein
VLQDYDIVGSYNNERFSNIDAERTVNLFEYRDPKAKKSKILISTSGLTNTGMDFSPNSSGSRASFIFNNITYQVFGSEVYQIQGFPTSFSYSRIGSLSTNTGYVGIEANTFQVIFVDGSDGYIYDTNAETFTQITDTSFPEAPIDVTYLDGFFVVANGNTNTFQLSSYNQGLVWGPAQNNFVSASATTDLITLASTVNYQTGIPVSFLIGDPGSSFTATDAGDLFTVSSTTNYPNGCAVRFTGGSLPPPVVINTTYYIINATATTFQISTTFGGSALVLTGNGSGTIIAQLPDGLSTSTTYYTIRFSSTSIRVATTYDNAINNIYIDLLSNGSPSNEILSEGQLQLGTITTHPGNIVACRTLHRKLFLFSKNFTEVWENAGIGTNLPFRRVNSVVMEIGTPAIGSISVAFDRMFFLSQDKDGLGSIVQVDGMQSTPVSTRALDFQLAQYAADPAKGVSDARGILIKENGLIFYRLNFTAADHTYVYNVTLSSPSDPLWHEEEMLDGSRHVAQTHFYYGGLNYYASYNQAVIYIVSPNVPNNDGEAIKRMRISRCMVPSTYNRTRIDRLQIDVRQGFVDIEILQDWLKTDEGQDLLTTSGLQLLLEQQISVPSEIPPIIFLSYSKDGGITYGNRLSGNMGKIGERTHRTVYRKLGTVPRGQGFISKTEFFNKVPFIVLGAAWSFEVMPE